ncbi:MAG: SET domain-containing protein-lysine N-methyltransferase [Dehalococcoidia bacterium]
MAEVAVRASAIGGLGVFTLEDLRAGQVVRAFELEREITPEAPMRPDRGERPEHCPSINGRRYLVGEPDRYFNHCCDPNVYLRFGSGGIDIVALRDIVAGSELTLDYLINNSGGDSWPCHCGAARCRGETGHSFFTLPEDLQREYFPLLAPWFLERYPRELDRLTHGSTD